MKINFKLLKFPIVTELYPIALKIIKSKNFLLSENFEDEDLNGTENYLEDDDWRVQVAKIYHISRDIIRVEFEDGDIIDFKIKI